MGKTLYDENWNVVGHLSDDGKTIYDQNWNVTGHVADDGRTIYDRNWNVVGHRSEDGRTVYDRNWNVSEHVSEDGRTTYDRNWNVKGHTEESSDCLLTTACVEYAGLPDNCEELEVMRWFRDTYVRSLPSGKQLLAEYYAIAPQIVQRIKSQPNATEVLERLLRKIRTVVRLIRSQEISEALRISLTEFDQLKKEYL